ncbi:MAG: phage holin family protein [Clostridia bacterium]|nr:phage holin family protein [Clostridia bacterium]
MNSLKAVFCTVSGVLGVILQALFGGWTEDMVTLIIVMSIDFILGLLIAGLFGKSPKSESGRVSSKSCFLGLCKKCTMLLFVLIAHRLDISLGTAYIKSAAVIAFIVNELISIVENAGLIGIPMPRVITKAIDLLKNKEEDESA